MRDRQAPAHELLDALLDGQPTAPAPQELAPLLQVAADLRREADVIESVVRSA